MNHPPLPRPPASIADYDTEKQSSADVAKPDRHILLH